MKIIKWEFEGTSDELRQVPELQSAFAAAAADAPTAAPQDDKVEGLVPSQCAEIIRRWSRTPEQAQLLLDLSERLVRTGLFMLEPGKSKRSGDGLNSYVMVYRRGPKTLGCMAYIGPPHGRVLARLPVEAAAQHPGADVKGNTGKYRLYRTVDTAASIEPAFELVMAALEHAAAA